jgi:hypothetical protein
MSAYPEHDRQALVVEQTQAIGEFLDWLETQGVQLMRYRTDLEDIRPTDPDCPERKRKHRDDPCWPTSDSDVGSALYYETHCLHWHGKARDADDCIQEPGLCCWCEKGREYTITTRGWVHEQRGTLQLLADWAEIDLAKIEAEKRQMLAAIRAANEQREGARS